MTAPFLLFWSEWFQFTSRDGDFWRRLDADPHPAALR